jgi:O-antigen/teichoic acid export membrane protein
VSAPPAASGPPLLLRNAGFLAVGEVLERLLGFAVAVWLARVLGAALYGTVGIAVSLTGFLAIAVAAGTTPIAIRELARDPGRLPALYARVAGLRGALALAVLAVLALAGPALAPRLGIPPLLLGLYALGLLPVALGCAWAFLGLERMHVVAVARVAERALVLGGLWLLVREATPVPWRVPAVEVGAAAAVALGLGLWLRRTRPAQGPRPAPPATRRLLAEGAPLAGALFLRTIYTQGDVVLLGALASTAAAGLFLASHKLVLTFTAVTTVLQQAALPETSRWLQRDPPRAVGLQADLLRWSLTLLLPVAVAGSLVGAEVLVLLFGPEYAPAAPVLRIAVWTLPLVAVAASHRALLLAAAAPGPQLAGVAVGAAAHVGLALALVPASGAKGAALACLLGEGVGAAALAWLTRARIGRSPLGAAAPAPLAAAAAAALPLALAGGPLAPRLLLAGALYAAGALAFGAVRRHELRRMRTWVGG